MDNEIITVGALSVHFLIEATDSNGTASVFECYVPANARMPAPHSHDGFEETIYGLEGVSTWTIDGETVEIGPGEGVCVLAAIGEVMRRHGLTPAPPGAA
jgi:quercetin dioxygenase-like cupin family protein